MYSPSKINVKKINIWSAQPMVLGVSAAGPLQANSSADLQAFEQISAILSRPLFL